MELPVDSDEQHYPMTASKTRDGYVWNPHAVPANVELADHFAGAFQRTMGTSRAFETEDDNLPRVTP